MYKYEVTFQQTHQILHLYLNLTVCLLEKNMNSYPEIFFVTLSVGVGQELAKSRFVCRSCLLYMRWKSHCFTTCTHTLQSPYSLLVCPWLQLEATCPHHLLHTGACVHTRAHTHHWLTLFKEQFRCNQFQAPLGKYMYCCIIFISLCSFLEGRGRCSLQCSVYSLRQNTICRGL